MFYFCTNSTCGKIFYGKVIHVGLQNKEFCSANCKDTHIYDTQIIKESQSLVLNTFQCPHCHKICKTSNPVQKICQSKKCKDEQRRQKILLKQKKYIEQLEKKKQKMSYKRNEAMEIAMIDALAKQHQVSNTDKVPLLPKSIGTKICIVCNEIFTLNPTGRKAKICTKEECKETHRLTLYNKYREKDKIRVKDKWAGREEERKEYYRQANLKHRKKMNEAARLAKLYKLSLLEKTDSTETIPPLKESVPTTIVPSVSIIGKAVVNEQLESLAAIKEHVLALNALVNNSTNKYQPLIDFLEVNKIDDMSKVSELMTIIGRITSDA